MEKGYLLHEAGGFCSVINLKILSFAATVRSLIAYGMGGLRVE
jgi:hypothetical protein